MRSIRHPLKLAVALASAWPFVIAAGPATDASPSRGADVSLEQAIERALLHHPSLAAWRSEVAASEAHVTQAGLLPNPELEIEAENFGGNGELAGYDTAEITAVVSQPLVLGGKRSRSRAVAESDRMLVGHRLEMAQLDVIAGVGEAFYRVVAAQQRVDLALQIRDLAMRFAATVQARVDAGKVSPVEATRAGIEVSRARVGLSRTERELGAARIELAAAWGASTADFGLADGELPEPSTPPPLSQLRSLLAATPDVALLDERVEQRRRVADLERAFRYPDLTVSVGRRRFEDTGESAWVAGVSMPIPIFDRNQGARRAAEHEIEREARIADSIRTAAEVELVATFERLQGIVIEATTMQDDIVPAATDAFTATERGYSAGKFGFLDVIDAQRELFAASSLLIDSLEELALVRVRLERQVGRPLWLSVGSSATGHDSGRGGGSL